MQRSMHSEKTAQKATIVEVYGFTKSIQNTREFDGKLRLDVTGAVMEFKSDQTSTGPDRLKIGARVSGTVPLRKKYMKDVRLMH